jgi:hypothetical protein
MKVHPYFHVKDNKLYVKRGKRSVEVKASNRKAHEKNLKGAGLWDWAKKKAKKLDKKKINRLVGNIHRTHNTVRGFFGKYQKGAKVVGSAAKMDADRRHMSHFAKAAYSQTRKVRGYDRVSGNKDVTFYRKPDSNQYIAAIAGTRPTAIRDIKADWSLAKNQSGNVKRIGTVRSQIEKFLADNPDAKINISGHSLGGMVAHHVYDDLSKTHGKQLGKVYSFNPGVSALAGESGQEGVKRYENILKKKGHVVSVIGNDAVSASVHGFKKTRDLMVVKPVHEGVTGLAKNHSVANFTT